MDHFVVQNIQKKHRLAGRFFEPEKKNKQINSASRFDNRTNDQQSSPRDSENWLNRQVYSVEVSQNILFKKRLKFFAAYITWL